MIANFRDFRGGSRGQREVSVDVTDRDITCQTGGGSWRSDSRGKDVDINIIIKY
jgi:hypothetical protein